MVLLSVQAAGRTQPLRDRLKTPLRAGFKALTAPARASLRRRLGGFLPRFFDKLERKMKKSSRENDTVSWAFSARRAQRAVNGYNPFYFTSAA
jgi:hypothetical protein